jgi:hypothetical protein
MGESLMNNKPQRMWKEAVMVYFEISQYLHGETEETHEDSVTGQDDCRLRF